MSTGNSKILHILTIKNIADKELFSQWKVMRERNCFARSASLTKRRRLKNVYKKRCFSIQIAVFYYD